MALPPAASGEWASQARGAGEAHGRSFEQQRPGAAEWIEQRDIRCGVGPARQAQDGGRQVLFQWRIGPAPFPAPSVQAPS